MKRDGAENQFSMVVRLTADEMAKIHAVARATREAVSVVVRRWILEAYAARFGDAPPPDARLRHGGTVRSRGKAGA